MPTFSNGVWCDVLPAHQYIIRNDSVEILFSDIEDVAHFVIRC